MPAKKVKTMALVQFAAIKEELTSATALLTAQTQAGLDGTDVLGMLFASSKDRLGQLADLTRPQIITLTQLCNDGPWTNVQKRELAQCIGGQLTSGLHAPIARRPNQTCAFIENFISEEKWRDVRSRRSTMLAKAHVLALAAASIGLINPSQPTLFRMVAVLAYCEECFDMTQQTVFDYMDKIQAFIKSAKVPLDYPYIVEYPPSAQQLPADLIEKVYPDGNLPVDVAIPELDTILAGKKQRGRNAEPAWLQSVPEAYRTMVALAVKREPSGSQSSRDEAHAEPSDRHEMMPLADTLRKLRSNLRPAIVPPELAPKVEYKDEFDDKLQDEIKGEPEDDFPVKAELATASGTVADMESAMLHASKSRESAKKVASKAGASKKGAAVMQRPAGADAPATTSASVLKRPATSMKRPAAESAAQQQAINLTKKINMKDIFKRLRNERKMPGMYKNKFTSTAYSAGRKRARQEGEDDAVCKLFGAIQYREAGKLWADTE
jgi:hypothetical protein